MQVTSNSSVSEPAKVNTAKADGEERADAECSCSITLQSAMCSLIQVCSKTKLLETLKSSSVSFRGRAFRLTARSRLWHNRFLYAADKLFSSVDIDKSFSQPPLFRLQLAMSAVQGGCDRMVI